MIWGPNFNEPWTIGASQIYSDDNVADNLGEYFDGAIDDVRIWSKAAPVLDGTVTGTAGADVIDTDYADDPEGDIADGQDAIDPNAAPNNDVISALGGDDTVDAGAGDDAFFGGDGDDRFTLNVGGILADGDTDVIDGGADGETDGDTISVSSGGAGETLSVIFDGDESRQISSTVGTSSTDFTEIEGISASGSNVVIDASQSDVDQNLEVSASVGATVTGGSGNDTIRTIGETTVDGGQGDDVIDGSALDTVIQLTDNFGDDTITGGEAGETDGDTLAASGLTTSGVNVDFSASEAGTVADDTTGDVATFFEVENIITTAQDDVIDTSAVTSGGVNAEAGGGNDTLIGGGGADTLSGGDDADTFSGLSGGDVITGGEGGTDDDTIKVGPDTPFNVVYDAADPTFDPATGESESGVIQLLDAPGGSVTGTIALSEIENIMCFTPGTLVATAQGQKLVETLTQDDLILTRDNGFQPIAWTGQRALTAQELAESPKIQPILIKANSLGEGVPERDMMVSPNHRMLVTDPKLQMYLHESEALVAAKHMTAIDGVAQMATSSLTYVHFMFERHEVVLADGAWSESFQPGDYSMNGMPSEQRAEIDMLFPELELTGAGAFMSARTQLKGLEERTLFGARKA